MFDISESTLTISVLESEDGIKMSLVSNHFDELSGAKFTENLVNYCADRYKAVKIDQERLFLACLEAK